MIKGRYTLSVLQIKIMYIENRMGNFTKFCLTTKLLNIVKNIHPVVNDNKKFW